MKMRYGLVKVIGLMLLVAVCVSCASKPIIDTANVDMEQYQRDLADCEQVATQVDTGGKAVKSAAAGAAIGAALGAVWGDVGTSAAGGAVSGGAGGMLSADEEKAQVTRNCLRNRGYAVLN
jgi:outer membrane lipoprotein SlyB